MDAAELIARLASTPFAEWVTREGDRVVLRYPLDDAQRAEDPATVTYYVESALQACNVEFVDQPMIEGGMLIALLTPAPDPIAFDD
ncbi:MAG: hypothetical protein U1E60_31500 [Reyranellaceae bacterium]